MEECEICGRASEELYLVNIEGTRMMACASCSKGKQVLQTFDFGKRVESKQINNNKTEPEDEIVDDYGMRIRKAREEMGLPLAVLAERISEKEGMLVRVERQSALPDVKLMKKLEKELGIKLTVKTESSGKVQLGRNEPLTLGDAAAIKKDDKK